MSSINSLKQVVNELERLSLALPEKREIRVIGNFGGKEKKG
jgi:hypothetical protein